MGRNKSKSSSDTTTTNNSGQNVIQGDNLGVSLSGINGNVGDITTTDHGSVETSFEFAEAAAELAMTSNTDVTTAALEANTKTTDRALNSVDGAVDKAFAFGEESLKAVNTATDRAFDFGERSLESVDEITSSSIKQLGDKHSENLQMMAGLSGSQGQQNSENIKAMLTLAKMKTDGGASLADKRVLWVAGIGFVSVAVLMYFMKKG